MPRVHHVKKARKDNSAVKAGQPYYWWKFRYGEVRKSASYPRQSQLCQGKNSMFYAALEALEDDCGDADGSGSLEETRDACVGSLEDVRDEYQEGFDNIPESLQYAPVGEQMEEAIQAIDELIDELGCWEFEEFEADPFDEEDKPVAGEFSSDDEYNDALFDWEEEKSDHAQDQAQQEEEHFTEQRDNLSEIAGNHCFPY